MAALISAYIRFKIHQLVHVVFLGEALMRTRFVLGYTSNQVVRNADVKDGVVNVGEEVDVISAQHTLGFVTA